MHSFRITKFRQPGYKSQYLSHQADDAQIMEPGEDGARGGSDIQLLGKGRQRR